MTTQPEKIFTHNAAAGEATDVQETGYDVFATVASVFLLIMFAAIVATQGIDYVAAKIDYYSDVTHWARR